MKKILLVNDDGIHADGIAAMEKTLREHCDVFTVAPAAEQSGISQAITFLRPLVPQRVCDGPRLRGYAVDGTPADCVKLALLELCPWKPDCVVSGMNGGLNVGINTLYSGTVGGAMEAALFGHVSFAVSLQYDEPLQYETAAPIALDIINEIMSDSPAAGSVFNINIPTAALQGKVESSFVPMETRRMKNDFVSGIDPKGRRYYWSNWQPDTSVADQPTDVTETAAGCVTITPLTYDLTDHEMLARKFPANDNSVTCSTS